MIKKSFRTKKTLRFSLMVAVIIMAIVVAILLTKYVNENGVAQMVVSEFGYFGILVISIIAGLNAIVPVPAATFVPVFLAAGLWMPLIILMLVIGTSIADLIGYFIGRWGKEFVEEQYPKTYARVFAVNEKHHNWIIPLVFFYSSFVPFPNEVILISLALAGVKLRTFIVPLILGTLVNQTALAYGFSSVFEILF